MTAKKRVRLASLDALRGFDMIWIIGGAAFLNAAAQLTKSESLINTVKSQTQHTPWTGMTAWDLIFPLFMFMAGVTMPYAITSKLEKGEGTKPAYKRLVRRWILLVLIGLSFTALKFDPIQIKPYNVLQLIGTGYLLAGIVVIHRPPKSQAIWAGAMLLGYWAAFMLIPVPGYGAGQLTPTGNLAGFLDRNLIPGKLHMGIFDPEGTIRAIPAAAMALIGACTGHYLRNAQTAALKHTCKLAASGCAMLTVGYLWSLVFSIIKPLWSSSYIVVSAGYSLLLLAVFYQIIDVWKVKSIACFFVPIGMNAITIYAGVHYIDVKHTATFFFGGLGDLFGPLWQAALVAAGVILIEWSLLYVMYRHKIFLKV